MAKHGKVKDNGEYFVINPASRKVSVPHIHKSIGTVGDHNSEQITFECPQMIDSHDISQCASRYVTWVNVRGEVGHDELQIEEVEQGKEGMLYLSWTIRNGLTVAKGIVQFSVHFEDFDEDGETLYRWSTATCKDCDILDSVNAVLGAYQAIYVAGDTLVIEDYTLVKDGVLELETNGLVPEGTLAIEENGTYEVGKYAQVKVDVINDPDLIPENIKEGVSIHGVMGTYNPIPKETTVHGTIRISSGYRIDSDVWFSGYKEGEELVLSNHSSFHTSEFDSPDANDHYIISQSMEFVKNSLIIIIIRKMSPNYNYYETLYNASLIEKISYDGYDHTILVIQPTAQDVTIQIHDSSYDVG